MIEHGKQDVRGNSSYLILLVAHEQTENASVFPQEKVCCIPAVKTRSFKVTGSLKLILE